MDINELYKKYINDVYRYAYFNTRSKEHAEDITSETFLRYFESKKILNDSEKKAYLIGIARFTMYEKFRKEKVQPIVIEENILMEHKDETLHLEDQVISQELSDSVKKELNKVDTLSKEIIILKVWEELKFEEIAEIVKQNINTVKSLYYKGIESIKISIQQKDKIQVRSNASPLILAALLFISKEPEFRVSSSFINNLIKQPIFFNFLSMNQQDSIVGSTISSIPANITAGATVLKTGLLASMSGKVAATIAAVAIVGVTGVAITSNNIKTPVTSNVVSYSNNSITSNVQLSSNSQGSLQSSSQVSSQNQSSSTSSNVFQGWLTYTIPGILSMQYPPEFKNKLSVIPNQDQTCYTFNFADKSTFTFGNARYKGNPQGDSQKGNIFSCFDINYGAGSLMDSTYYTIVNGNNNLTKKTIFHGLVSDPNKDPDSTYVKVYLGNDYNVNYYYLTDNESLYKDKFDKMISSFQWLTNIQSLTDPIYNNLKTLTKWDTLPVKTTFIFKEAVQNNILPRNVQGYSVSVKVPTLNSLNDSSIINVLSTQGWVTQGEDNNADMPGHIRGYVKYIGGNNLPKYMIIDEEPVCNGPTCQDSSWIITVNYQI